MLTTLFSTIGIVQLCQSAYIGSPSSRYRRRHTNADQYQDLERRGNISSTFAQSDNNTISNSKLQTWWHNTGEINTDSSVQDGNVRQSHLYSVQVANANDQVYYNSFVYQTIPRNGQGSILVPNDPSSTTDAGDGITVEAAIGMTMSWSTFLYTEDVWVKVHRLDDSEIGPDSVIIRPTNLGMAVSFEDGDFVIHIPYSARGSKFSVEFSDDLYNFHNGCSQPSCSYVQDSASIAEYYVDGFSDSMPVMGSEPRHSLLIFASPFEDNSLVPDKTASGVLVVPEGLVSGLDTTDAKIVIFEPGSTMRLPRLILT